VAKPEWGKKRQCPSCGTKFYDLRKSPPQCPSCGESVDVEAAPKSKRSRGGKGEQAAARKPAAAPAEEALESATSEETSLDETAPYPEEEGEDLEDTAELGEEESFTNVVGDDDEESS
jgi:uncharacterized protein (TIGR02300 family)